MLFAALSFPRPHIRTAHSRIGLLAFHERLILCCNATSSILPNLGGQPTTQHSTPLPPITTNTTTNRYKRILREDKKDRKEARVFQGDPEMTVDQLKRTMVLDDRLPEIPAGIRGIVLEKKMEEVKIKSTVPKPVKLE
jgi:hypothetical protein